MKLSIVVLSSILAVCSVTTAIPVNPSAAASAGASTSTVIPSAQVIPPIDFSNFSDKDMKLIKEYTQAKKDYDNAEEMQKLTQSKMHVQEKLVKRLNKKIKKLPRKSQISENGSKHSEKLQELEDKLEQERKTLYELIKMQRHFDLFNLTFKLGKTKAQLLNRLFGKNQYQPFEYYTRFLESDPEFTKLVKTFSNSAPSQQLGSQQDSTSGAHSSSQHHKSPSSSSETSTVQPTQASSSTQKASKSSRLQKVYREIKDGFELGWNQDKSGDRKLLIDSNTNLD
ncbi:hypothetical protein BATDEDRAFT_88847 [Batrachochytrium dendrobatidis JAM81]|uniref:Uncharacterized protein n=2 Tax=Batrachochytrium dendrobatidis TaxID=109871 RepID=F4P2S5_BATDJ|nr:uncharacterized protein BATDEDRAFT_88847 [Batrachochytrium dendrobatidis JAM81]EGF80327.1 hypothetical protein BATDEDRAFT_88847 [Batrachochytrium dendrobatidis JAM81]|eukprot:XP_006679246.1 hypothetical protein BATDEDRAFT_88847 [Batrachochytrium dendrobatidis JAM81]